MGTALAIYLIIAQVLCGIVLISILIDLLRRMKKAQAEPQQGPVADAQSADVPVEVENETVAEEEPQPEVTEISAEESVPAAEVHEEVSEEPELAPIIEEKAIGEKRTRKRKRPQVRWKSSEK